MPLEITAQGSWRQALESKLEEKLMADEENDRALAMALTDRRNTKELFDEKLARTLYEEDLANYASTLGPLPALPSDERQLRLERRVSERLSAEAAGILPHVPRTNSAAGEEFSWGCCDEDAPADRARLLRRLAAYSLCEREIKGDGNCQFRALSDQLYRTPVYHAQVRQAAVAQLRRHPDAYAQFVEGDWGAYLHDMQRQGTWGDHLTLQAVADHFGVKIFVLTSYEEGEVIEITPSGPLLSERILYLSFWAEVHYNSLFPQADPPSALPHDKTLGSRRLYHLLHRNGGEVY